jgi:hypothetical protein
MPESDRGTPLEPEIQVILDSVAPLPACVYNARWDLLAWNAAYASIFPRIVTAPPAERNVLWQTFTQPACCCPFLNRDEELPRMAATLRGSFGRHVGEPAWADFVRRLSAASPEFAALWAGQDVAEPGTRYKVFRHDAVGVVRMTITSLAIQGTPEARLAVYCAADDESRTGIEWLVAHPGVMACRHHGPFPTDVTRR